jgi:hypothetical protein
MTEIVAVERLWDWFINNMNNHPLHMGALQKYHTVLGDDDGRLWHFTRFSVLKQMLAGRQIWLSDLTFCNDTDEICYGLRRVKELVKDIHEGWDPSHVRVLQQLAKQAADRFGEERHVYAFSLSVERDTRQHWDAYGGGLHNPPDADNPHIAIGFDAKALAWPLELSSSDPPIYLFSVATVDEHADRLADYWTVRALKTLIWLDGEKGETTRTLPPTKQVHDALERMLAFTSAVMKHPGWNSEHECRLLYVNKAFGEKDESAFPRPDGLGYYVPLTWTSNRMPIQAIVVHPLGQAGSVERKLTSLRGGKNIEVIPSQLKPRLRG